MLSFHNHQAQSHAGELSRLANITYKSSSVAIDMVPVTKARLSISETCLGRPVDPPISAMKERCHFRTTTPTTSRISNTNFRSPLNLQCQNKKRCLGTSSRILFRACRLTSSNDGLRVVLLRFCDCLKVSCRGLHLTN